MLYQFKQAGKTLSLEAMRFYDYADIGNNEKDLENLLAQNLGKLYAENGQLMPIFQERPFQPEPDLLALDEAGNLVIFELKRSNVNEDTTIQIMRYTQKYGRKEYTELDRLYKGYKGKEDANDILAEEHQVIFGLEKPLPRENFNQKQIMIIVGSSSDVKLIEAITYWKDKGIDIDFLPYRLYNIHGEMFFEFFAKPYDYHINPKDKKGIIFIINKTNNVVWDMFKNRRVSAYGEAGVDLNKFNQEDYIFYYYGGKGVIGAGLIKSNKIREDKANEEMYLDVELLTPELRKEEDIQAIALEDLAKLLGGKNFLLTTAAKPYLSEIDSKILVNELRQRYQESPLYKIRTGKELVKEIFHVLDTEMQKIGASYDLERIPPAMREDDQDKWGDYSCCVEQYAAKKIFPGVYYKCNSVQLGFDGLELWFGIEVEESLYAGFLVFNPQENNCVNGKKRSPELKEKLAHILNTNEDRFKTDAMPVWEYLHTSASNEEINLRRMNDAAKSLYDEHVFQKSINSMMEQIKDMLKHLRISPAVSTIS